MGGFLGIGPDEDHFARERIKALAATHADHSSRISKVESASSTHTSNFNTLTASIDALSTTEANKQFDAQVPTDDYPTVSAAFAASKYRVKIVGNASETANWTPASDVFIHIDQGVTYSMSTFKIDSTKNVYIFGVNPKTSKFSINSGNGTDFVTAISTGILAFKDVYIDLTSGILTANRALVMSNCEVNISTAASTNVNFNIDGSASYQTVYHTNAYDKLNVDFKYGKHTRVKLDANNFVNNATAVNVRVDPSSSDYHGTTLTDVTFTGTSYKFIIENNGHIQNLFPVNITPNIDIYSSPNAGGSNNSSIEGANLGSGIVTSTADHSYQRFINVRTTGNYDQLAAHYINAVFDGCRLGSLTSSSENLKIDKCHFSSDVTLRAKSKMTNSHITGNMIAINSQEVDIENCEFAGTVQLAGDGNAITRMTGCRVANATTLGGFTQIAQCELVAVTINTSGQNNIMGCRITGATTISTLYNKISDSYLTSYLEVTSGTYNVFRNLVLTSYTDAANFNTLSDSSLTLTLDIQAGSESFHGSNLRIAGAATFAGDHSNLSGIHFQGTCAVTGANNKFDNIRCASSLSISSGNYNTFDKVHIATSLTLSSNHNKISNFYVTTTSDLDGNYNNYINGTFTGVATTDADTVDGFDRNVFNTCVFTVAPVIVQVETTFNHCTFVTNQTYSGSSSHCNFVNCHYLGTLTSVGTHTRYLGCRFTGVVNVTDGSFTSCDSCVFYSSSASAMDQTKGTTTSCLVKVTFNPGSPSDIGLVVY